MQVPFPGVNLYVFAGQVVHPVDPAFKVNPALHENDDVVQTALLGHVVQVLLPNVLLKALTPQGSHPFCKVFN